MLPEHSVEDVTLIDSLPLGVMQRCVFCRASAPLLFQAASHASLTMTYWTSNGASLIPPPGTRCLQHSVRCMHAAEGTTKERRVSVLIFGIFMLFSSMFTDFCIQLDATNAVPGTRDTHGNICTGFPVGHFPARYCTGWGLLLWIGASSHDRTLLFPVLSDLVSEVKASTTPPIPDSVPM